MRNKMKLSRKDVIGRHGVREVASYAGTIYVDYRFIIFHDFATCTGDFLTRRLWVLLTMYG